MVRVYGVCIDVPKKKRLYVGIRSKYLHSRLEISYQSVTVILFFNHYTFAELACFGINPDHIQARFEI